MKNGIDKIRVIDRKLLREDDFFQSLLEQAHEKGLLNEADIERLQYECLALLAYKTERFNAGDSSSIRVEQAQSLMASIFFTVGLWLKTFPNPDEAIDLLQNEQIEAIYNRGRKRIDAMRKATKALHAKLCAELIETPNVFYASTIRDAIAGFFKLYDPDYAAQEIHITADYPLFNPMPRLAGIEFIKDYVTGAYYENQFCALFPTETVHRVLSASVPSYRGMGYEEQLVNLYGPVLKATLRRHTAAELASRLECSEGLARYMRESVKAMRA